MMSCCIWSCCCPRPSGASWHSVTMLQRRASCAFRTCGRAMSGALALSALPFSILWRAHCSHALAVLLPYETSRFWES